MKIHAELPVSRFAEGRLWVFDDAGRILLGPARCRGEADNTGAREHDNIQEDPTLAYGDHPFGLYQVSAVVHLDLGDPKRATYGPAFIRLNPLDGEALDAKRNGRSGLGIHGGRLHTDGRLRETFGCLRVDDDVAHQIAALLDGRGVVTALYDCIPAATAVA